MRRKRVVVIQQNETKKNVRFFFFFEKFVKRMLDLRVDDGERRKRELGYFGLGL